jgi:hypothetical protein
VMRVPVSRRRRSLVGSREPAQPRRGFVVGANTATATEARRALGRELREQPERSCRRESDAVEMKLLPRRIPAVELAKLFAPGEVLAEVSWTVDAAPMEGA